MIGRESSLENDIFYVCGLIERIGRFAHNRRCDIADAIGQEQLARLVSLADMYHCENIDAVRDDLIAQCGIEQGSFDNVGDARCAVPSHRDIGKVYKRLTWGFFPAAPSSIPLRAEPPARSRRRSARPLPRR